MHWSKTSALGPGRHLAAALPCLSDRGINLAVCVWDSAALEIHMRVTDSLFISNARSACSTELIQKEAVTLCINVSRQQPCPSARVSSTLRVPVYDDPNEDLHAHFDRCADVILGEAARGGRTVIYCKNGRSRSATICIAYLMKHQNLSLSRAYEVVKSARSVVEPNPGFWAQLERYEQELKSRRSASSSLSVSPS